MNGETYSAGAQFWWVSFFLSSSGRQEIDTGCLSPSTTNGSRKGNGRGVAAQPQSHTKRNALILESLPRADSEAERRDARALVEGFSAEADQDLETLIAHRRGRETEVVRHPQIAGP